MSTAFNGINIIDISKNTLSKTIIVLHGNVSNNNGITPLDECMEPWSGEISKKVDFLNQVIKVGVKAKDVEIGRPMVLAMLKEHVAKSDPDEESRPK